jgi:hypothetical protein
MITNRTQKSGTLASRVSCPNMRNNSYRNSDELGKASQKKTWPRSSGCYHDGRFPTLLDVVQSYNTRFGLGLTDPEMRDVVEDLKSL